jgi:hypothetical protein
MNIRLIRAWMENGSAPLDDLGPILGVRDVELIKIMNGNKWPDKGMQQLLATVFKKKVEDLFDEFGG